MSEIKFSNRLVNASYHLSKPQIKVLALLFYNSRKQLFDAKNNRYFIRISSSEYREVYSLNATNVIRHIHPYLAMSEIKNINIEEKRETEREAECWITYSDYFRVKNKTYFDAVFSQFIINCLCVKSNFTLIPDEYLIKLAEPTTFRLYMWAKSKHNYSTHCKNGRVEVLLSFKDIIKKMKFDKDMEWDTFNRRYLKPAIQRINEFTELSMHAIPIKKQKKVTSVKLIYTIKQSIKQKG